MVERMKSVGLSIVLFIGLLAAPCFGEVGQATLPKEITNSMGMKFVLIPAGRFTMGSPPTERGSQEDEVLHKVELTQQFHLGTTEVTEHQWATVMEDVFETKVVEIRDPETKRLVKKEERKIKNPKLGSQLPVTGISWTQAVEFCRRLGQIPEEKKEGRTYRLPTEAEWEYACRAGTSTAYSFGDDADGLDAYGWFSGNSGGEGPKPVAEKRPNAWGLYDMHGNAAEWCHDYYGAYGEGVVNNPVGPDVLLAFDRVVRGGAFGSKESQCRSSWRGQHPDESHVPVGFRVLLGSNSPVGQVDTIVNSIGQRLVKIPAGTFMMGSPESDIDAAANEQPQHQVTISRSFYMGEAEVTQGQWKAVMGTEPWAKQNYVREGVNYPATYVSWDDAVSYCEKLSQLEGKTYRLPTEGEWEYACRGGTTTKYCFGDNPLELSRYGWFSKTADGEEYAHEVKKKLANPIGLYDMHGNVWEWCSDWYGDYLEGLVVDPMGPGDSSRRLRRGGSWDSQGSDCRSAFRRGVVSSYRRSDLGFRLVLSPSAN